MNEQNTGVTGDLIKICDVTHVVSRPTVEQYMLHLKTISYSTAREVKMATGENELAQMSCEDFGEFKVTTEVLWYNVEESNYFVKSFTCSVESIIGRSIYKQHIFSA